MGQHCFFYSECESEASILIPSTKMPLCSVHFIKYTENRVWKMIDGPSLLKSKSKEKILVALSGGKDSQALLYILDALFHKRIQIEGLYINLHIEENDYSSDSLRMAQKLCEQLGIPFHSIDVFEVQGYGIDDLYLLKERIKNKESNSNREKEFISRGECSFCGEAKRYYINKFAIENGFTRVVTGHNLDDEATKFLQNLLSMNLFLISRSGPIVDSKEENVVPRIKPFYYISEQEIALYCYLKSIAHVETECPYSKTPVTKFKYVLHEIDAIQQGAIFGLMKKYQKVLKPVLQKSLDELNPPVRCSVCGMISSWKKCAHCKTNQFVSKYLDIPCKSKIKNHETTDEMDKDDDEEGFDVDQFDFDGVPMNQTDFSHCYFEDIEDEEKNDEF